MTISAWDEAYTRSVPAAWDIGRPQKAFIRLADAGLFCGRLLDVGCGTGEHAMLAASRGADALGVDMSPLAIEQARAKAKDRGLTARFEVGNALELGQLGVTFDTVIDSALFHNLDDDERGLYVAGLTAVVPPGGLCYLMCYSDRQPGDAIRPRRIHQHELRDSFSGGWTVISIIPDILELNYSTEAEAWLATVQRK